jgi:uncharacterized protein YjbI with pentapeptide repeats
VREDHLADEAIVDLLRQGHAVFNSWRLKNPGAEIDLREANLVGLDLSKCNLIRANLSGARMLGVRLIATRLEFAVLDGADLGTLDGRPAELAECQATNASFVRAKLQGSRADRAFQLAGGDLTEADLSDVAWDGSNLVQAILRNAVLSGASLRTVQFNAAVLDGASAAKRSERAADFAAASFVGAKLRKAVLDNAILDGADLCQADLSGSSLRGTSARRARFELADMRGADLRNLRPDRETNLASAKVQGTRIYRYTLEYLKDYGGLTAAERAEMEVINDVAKLRQNFSGVFAVMHATALVLFVVPYLWFVASHYAVARFAAASPADPTLLAALGRFIVSGGRDWTQWAPSWRVIPFLVLLLYNGLRAVLLYKTKSLELEELTTGLPSRFSFDEHPGWGRTFQLARWLFWGMLFVVLVHTINFMMVRVPV